jgi:hypothetical protein
VATTSPGSPPHRVCARGIARTFQLVRPFAGLLRHRTRRRGSQDATIYCHRLERYVPPDIVECSEFKAVTALSLSEMADIALHPDEFERPEQVRV